MRLNRLIRIKQSTDIDLIRRMDKRCLPGCYFYLGEYWWIVWDGKIPVGYAGMAQSKQWNNCGYFCRAGIIPEYRGRGLQKRLIHARLRFARSLGWEAVVTDTRQNPASANSLISCGFTTYIPRNPWGFSDCIYWRKWL